jgi:hypothetical protein
VRASTATPNSTRSPEPCVALPRLWSHCVQTRCFVCNAPILRCRSSVLVPPLGKHRCVRVFFARLCDDPTSWLDHSCTSSSCFHARHRYCGVGGALRVIWTMDVRRFAHGVFLCVRCRTAQKLCCSCWTMWMKASKSL